MRRLAGCLVVSLVASAATWAGCRDDLGDELPAFAIGSGTDAGMGGDAYGGGTLGLDAIVVVDDAIVLADGSGEGGVPDAGIGSDAGIPDAGIPDAGIGSDAGIPDAGLPDAGIPDAGSGSDARGEGGVPDAGSDGGGGGGTDDGGGGGGTDDGGGTGRPDARRGPEIDPVDRTSFYACAGGPASAGLEVGLPIGLALAIAVRRRRRWRRTGAPDRAA